MNPYLRCAAALMLALQGAAASACGHCIEDKVASVYDHAVVMKALGRSHHVAFFGIDGPLEPGESMKRALITLVDGTSGVDKGSVRVSVESGALSFGFDPKRVPLGRLLRALEPALTARGLSLQPLQVMDRTLTGRRASK